MILKAPFPWFGGKSAVAGLVWDRWKARGGFGSQGSGDNVNATRERIWFSPHCLGVSGPVQGDLFSEEAHQ